MRLTFRFFFSVFRAKQIASEMESSQELALPSPQASVEAHANWLSTLFDTQSEWNLAQALQMLRSLFCAGVSSETLTNAYASITKDDNVTIQAPVSMPFTRVINAPLYVTSQTLAFDVVWNTLTKATGAQGDPGTFTLVHLPWKGWREIYCYLLWSLNTTYSLVGADQGNGSGPSLPQQPILGSGAYYDSINGSLYGPYGIPAFIMPPAVNESTVTAPDQQMFATPMGGNTHTGVAGGAYASNAVTVPQIYNQASAFPNGYNYGPFNGGNYPASNGYLFNPGSIAPAIGPAQVQAATYNGVLIAAPARMQPKPGFNLDASYYSGRIINVFASCSVSTNQGGTNANGQVEMALLTDVMQPSFSTAILKQQGGKNFIRSSLVQASTADGNTVGGACYVLGPNVLEEMKPLTIELLSGTGNGARVRRMQRIQLHPSGVCAASLSIAGADPWAGTTIPGTETTYPAGPWYDTGYVTAGENLAIAQPVAEGTAMSHLLNVPCAQFLTINSPQGTNSMTGWVGGGVPPPSDIPAGGAGAVDLPTGTSGISTIAVDNGVDSALTVPAYAMANSKWYGIPLLIGPNPIAFGRVFSGTLNDSQNPGWMQTAGPALWITSYRMTGWNWLGAQGVIAPSDSSQTKPFAKNMITDSVGGCFGYMAMYAANATNVSGSYAQLKSAEQSESLVGNWTSGLLPHVPFNGSCITPNKLIETVPIEASPEGLPPIFSFTWTLGPGSTRAFHFGQGFHLWLRFDDYGVLTQLVEPFSFGRWAGSAPMSAFGTAQPRPQDIAHSGFNAVSLANTNIGNVPAPDHTALITGQGCDIIGGGIFMQHRETVHVPNYPGGAATRDDKYSYVATYVGYNRQCDGGMYCDITVTYPRYYDDGVIGPGFVTHVSGLTNGQQFNWSMTQMHQVVANAETAALDLSSFTSAPIIGEKFQQLIQFLFQNPRSSSVFTCVKTNMQWRRLVALLYKPGSTFSGILAEVIASDGATRLDDIKRHVHGTFGSKELVALAGNDMLGYVEDVLAGMQFKQDKTSADLISKIRDAYDRIRNLENDAQNNRRITAGGQIGGAGGQIGGAGGQIGASGEMGEESECDVQSADDEEEERIKSASAGGLIFVNGKATAIGGTPNRGVSGAPFVSNRRYNRAMAKPMGTNMLQHLSLPTGSNMTLEACMTNTNSNVVEEYQRGATESNKMEIVTFKYKPFAEAITDLLGMCLGTTAFPNMQSDIAQATEEIQTFLRTLKRADAINQPKRAAGGTSVMRAGRQRDKDYYETTTTGVEEFRAVSKRISFYTPFYDYGVLIVTSDSGKTGFLSSYEWGKIRRMHAGKLSKRRTTIGDTIASGIHNAAARALQVIGALHAAMAEDINKLPASMRIEPTNTYETWTKPKRSRGSHDTFADRLKRSIVPLSQKSVAMYAGAPSRSTSRSATAAPTPATSSAPSRRTSRRTTREPSVAGFLAEDTGESADSDGSNDSDDDLVKAKKQVARLQKLQKRDK